MTLLRTAMVPLAGLCVALAVLIGGRAATTLAAVSVILFGVAAFLTLAGE